MNKFILKLMFAALSAMVLCTLFAVPFSLAFAGVIGSGVLLHYVAKATGEMILFDTLSPDLIKELETLRDKLKADSVTKAEKEAIEKRIKELEDKGYIAKADVQVMLDEKDKANQKALDEMSAEIKLLREQGLSGASKDGQSIQKQIEKGLEGMVSNMIEKDNRFVRTVSQKDKVADILAYVKDNNINGYKQILVIKANTDPITISGSYSGGIIGLTDFDTSYNRVPQYKPFLRNIVNVRPTSKTYIGWAEQTGIEGDAGMVAEAAEKPQNTFKTVERNERIKKLAKWAETSKENLDDLPFMASEIRTEIIEAIARLLDVQLLEGDGTGENLKGILEYAPEFNIAGTPLVNTVINANNYDVLRTAAAQIAVNSKDNFIPNYFVIHPWAAAAMDMAKSTDGIYVIPPFTTVDGRRIAGMVGIENSRVGVDDFLVGDFTKSNLAIREDIVISVGYKGNDFIENLVTILGEMRALHYIKANHVTAFVQGDFSFAKGQLDPDAVSA